MSDLSQLAQPFPGAYIQENPSGGGSYVKHHIVTQRLLMDLGPFSWELKEILRGSVPAIEPNPRADSARGKAGRPALDNAVVGVVGALTAKIDGREVRIEEVGDCEAPHNWPHDGARLKDASSDALKRCAMRLGLGLHLWSAKPGEYFLANVLAKRERTPDQVLKEARDAAALGNDD